MPVKVDPTEVPTLIIQPDQRFATTFLSSKYRDYAVPGEAIMDKASGELFFKRSIDGKVISFSQNKKMIHDLVLELRILLTNNEGFTYPVENENAFFVSTNYDLIAIHDEALYNLITDDIVIPNGPNDINKLTFKIAGESNGFFCRNTTRDCDKPFIEFLTNQYNSAFEFYSGMNEEYTAEHNKFNSNQKWKDSNVILIYDLDVYKDGEKQKTYSTLIDYIRLNEEVSVLFPDYLYTDFPNGIDYFVVTIRKFEYYKIHFMIQHKNEFGDSFINAYNKFLFADGRVEVSELNIMQFVNNCDDVDLLGNEIILAFLDIPYINRYMSKMSKLKASSQFITSINRPVGSEWGANTVWAERIRDVAKEGIATETGSENSFFYLETYFSKNNEDIISGRIVTDPNLDDDFLLIEIS